MTETRIAALVAELDALVPREGAVISEDEGLYGSQSDPAYIGNPQGYRRLGIELLKIADAPSDPRHPNRVLVDLAYLMDRADLEEGELAIFERREDVTGAAMHADRGGFGESFLGIAFVMVFLGSLVVGFFVIAGFVVRLLRPLLSWMPG